jgi:hypothetical protein
VRMVVVIAQAKIRPEGFIVYYNDVEGKGTSVRRRLASERRRRFHKVRS